MKKEHRLTELARNFRGTRDVNIRQQIAHQYHAVVDQLIAGGRWKLIPPIEDQLPDDYMPKVFFSHWGLLGPLHNPE